MERASGTPVLAIDAGDALFPSPILPLIAREGAKARAEVIASTYGRVLDAFVPGEMDAVMGGNAFVELARTHKLPVVAVNLVDDKGQRVFSPAMVKQLGEVKVLVVGVVAPSAWRVTGTIQATEPVQALQGFMQSAPPHDVAVLVAHAVEEEARLYAQSVPRFSWVMFGHAGQLFFQPRTVELPPGGTVKHALILSNGKEGKYVARISAVHVPGMVDYQGGEARAKARYAVETAQKKLKEFPGNTAARAELKNATDILAAQDKGSHADFQSLPLPPEAAESVAVKEAVDAVELALAAQAQQVADKGAALDSLPGSRLFVGADVCIRCHVEEGALWQTSRHAAAMANLGQPTHPLAKEKECVACHATGFKQQGGFASPGAVGHLSGVQCEACHDAGRVHAQLGRTGNITRNPQETTCRKCHTSEASPRFQQSTYRERIRHWLGP